MIDWDLDVFVGIYSVNVEIFCDDILSIKWDYMNAIDNKKNTIIVETVGEYGEGSVELIVPEDQEGFLTFMSINWLEFDE